MGPTVVREPPPVAATPVEVLRVRGTDAVAATDVVATEEPLEIHLNGWRWLVTMRTPGDDADLMLGLLASEGIITSASDVEAILFRRHPEEPDLANVADVRLIASVEPDRARLTRHQALASSSCGVCGASTIEAVLKHRPPLPPGPCVDGRVLADLPERLRPRQTVFATTGGLHAAALFDPFGRLLAHREDVGRHNATDKVLGWRLRAPEAAAETAILLVSGRASFEIVQKAHAAGIAIVAAVSAPSSLAVAFARDAHMTLAGFVREGRLNVYTGLARVASDGDAPSGEAAEALHFVPRMVRTALDGIGRKISLRDWQALSLVERATLVRHADSRATAEFSATLESTVLARTGAAPRPLPPRAPGAPR